MTRRIIATVVLLAALVILTAGWACSPQNAVALLKTANQLADAWIGVYGTAQDKTTVDAAFAAAITAIQTGGTPCADILAAVNAVSVILEELPTTNQQAKLLIATVDASVQIVAGQFAQCAPPKVTQKVPKAPEIQAIYENGARTPAELKAQWKKLGGPQ